MDVRAGAAAALRQALRVPGAGVVVGQHAVFKALPCLAAAAAGQVHADKPHAAHHEIGNGITTLLAMGAAEWLGVPVARVSVHLGDTDLPPASVAGGTEVGMAPPASAPAAPGAAAPRAS